MMQSEMVDSEVQELPGLVLDRPLGQIEHLLSLLSTGKVRLWVRKLLSFFPRMIFKEQETALSLV